MCCGVDFDFDDPSHTHTAEVVCAAHAALPCGLAVADAGQRSNPQIDTSWRTPSACIVAPGPRAMNSPRCITR